MKRIRVWARRAAGLFARDRRERELSDEIESHLALHTDENIRCGMTPDAARRAAVLQLGSAEALKERYRDQRGLPLVDHLGQDVRYASRTLRRSPGFTVIAAATIAIGIAGPTVMFSMTKAWILDPLPFADPDSLVDVRAVDTATGDTSSLTPADLLDVRRGAGSLAALAAYRQANVTLTGGDRAERLRGAQVTTDFFAVLGVDAALGRVFGAVDDRAASSAVVISHALWRERFSGDPAVLGRTLQLEAEDSTVVGVLPDGFQFTLLGNVQVWRPLVFTPEDAVDRRARSVTGLGRLRDAGSIGLAREETARIARDLAAAFHETNGRRGIRVMRLADEIRVHHDLGFLVPVLFAMVGCVMVIACVNVTNVMLARTSVRRQEMAVRLALGASRMRIVRQWLVEHLMVFVGASALGAVLAVYGTSWVTASIPVENRQYLRNFAVLSVDRTVLGFALAMGVIAGVVFGLVPAWTSARADVNADLREGSTRISAGKAGSRLRGALVVSQVALALAILVAAALLVQTTRNILSADLGFDADRLLTFEVSLDRRQYRTPAAVRGFYDRLVSTLSAQPGVTSAAAGSLVPFGTEGRGAELFIDGRPDPPAGETPGTALSEITGGYADAMRLRLRRGRFLGPSDTAEATKVAMINETLASRHFASTDPIGERLRLGRESVDLWTVVGVVADVKNYQMIDQAEPQVYLPFAQQPSRRATVVLRASGDPESLIPAARAAVASVDPAEPVWRAFAMHDLIAFDTAPFRTMAGFVTFFGAVTLLLAGVGVYGVVSYTFARRTREIGIRLALGARRADVAALVVRQIRVLLIAGFVPGVVLAWILARALSAMLVGVTPTDWRIYGTMCLVLAAVAIAAAAVPARRATAVDPVTVLRCE